MDKENINLKTEIGDRYLQDGKYVEAYQAFEEVLTHLRLFSEKGKKSKSIGNAVGWTTGLLTGGLGFEDLFIIPAVSKGVSSLLGADDNYVNSLSNLVILKQIDSILKSNELLNTTNKNVAVQKFALLFSTADNQKDIFDTALNLYLPNLTPANLYDNSEAITASYYYLEQAIDFLNYQTEDYAYLLFSYLSKTNDNSNLFAKLRTMFDAENSYSEKDESNINNKAEQGQNSKAQCYSTLGVSETATTEEVRKAYRGLISKYHPDKFASLSGEFQEIAERKTREIIEAYEVLTKRD